MVAAKQMPEVLADRFEAFIDEYRRHCRYEEELPAKYGYPGLTKQSKEHRMFLDHLENMKARMRSGSLSLAEADVDVLVRWVEEHVDGVDYAYGEFLTSEGAE